MDPQRAVSVAGKSALIDAQGNFKKANQSVDEGHEITHDNDEDQQQYQKVKTQTTDEEEESI